MQLIFVTGFGLSFIVFVGNLGTRTRTRSATVLKVLINWSMLPVQRAIILFNGPTSTIFMQAYKFELFIVKFCQEEN